MLGVSAATLRRLAKSYEAAFGELPTDGAGGRIYPDEALDLMQEARDLVSARRVGTLEQAFKLLANDREGAEIALQQTDTPALLQELMTEIRAMRHMIERLSADNAELQEHVRALPTASEEREARQRIAELERRNQVLRNELERRDKEAAEKRQGFLSWFGLKRRSSA
jgi:flagellar motility protein MotE (MotC chaperone)